jgi:hypothetical protein
MTERLKLLNSYVNKLKRREIINRRNDDLYPFINCFAESRPSKTNIPKVNVDEKMIQDIKFKKSSRKLKEFPQDLIRKMIESNDISSIQICLKSFPKFFVFPLSSDYTPFVNDFDTLKFLVDNQIISKINIKNCRCLYMNFDKKYFQYLFENNENNLEYYILAFNNFWFEPFEKFKNIFKNNLTLTIHNSNYFINNISISYPTLIFLLDNNYRFETISYTNTQKI